MHEAAEALASLASDSAPNQTEIARLLVQLIRGANGRAREKAARAISRFSRAHTSNQDAIATAGGIELVVSLIEPRKAQAIERIGFGLNAAAKDELPAATEHDGTDPNDAGEHHLIQKELASALWSVSFNNASNQIKVSHFGAIPLLIALLSDHADIHRDAAGALWSLASDADR